MIRTKSEKKPSMSDQSAPAIARRRNDDGVDRAGGGSADRRGRRHENASYPAAEHSISQPFACAAKLYSAESSLDCLSISNSATAHPNCAGLHRKALAVRASIVFASSGVTFSTVWRTTVGYFSIRAHTAT